METEALTVREAADFLKVHPRTIARLVKDRQLPCAKIGGSLRFSRRKLTEILEEGIQTKSLRSKRTEVNRGRQDNAGR